MRIEWQKIREIGVNKSANHKFRKELIVGLFLMSGLILISCDSNSSNIIMKRIQLAPNTAATCSANFKTDCFIVRENFRGWQVITADFPNFKYEKGYLYDMDVQITCPKHFLGDAILKVTSVMVLSKTVSDEVVAGMETSWPGLC